jgi:hypothetical protein
MYMSFQFLEDLKGMKKTHLLGAVAGIIIVCVLLVCFAASMANAETDARMQRSMPLRGEHQLHRMSENATNQGNYFIIFGDTKKAIGSDLATIKFAWKMSDGTYQVASLPLEKIRLKFDQNAETPNIKFSWDYQTDIDDIQNFMYFVDFATITLNESDWSPQVMAPVK